jgi:hypothetical protein
MKYKFELKRISYNARLSQETSAFAADIYVDGVKAGTAENAGHGGNTNCSLHLLPADDRRVIEAWIKAQPPKVYDMEIRPGENSQLPLTWKSSLTT